MIRQDRKEVRSLEITLKELTELEKLQRENERLKRQLEDKERENIILKKLQEVERRRYSPKGNRNRSI